MLFNEKEMLELCERYGIDVIDRNNEEYYENIDFSMKDIMQEPYIHTIVEKCVFSTSISIDTTLIAENDLEFCNDNENNTCSIIREKHYDDLISVVGNNSVINKAA